jgi:TRAP-type C4-dicarboxylate transport system substrate-binding protein
MMRSCRSIAGLMLAFIVTLGVGSPDGVAAQEIKLKLSHFLPTSHNHHANVVVPWTEEIKKRTNGKVEITVFPDASLCEPPEQYDCAKSGIVDLAWGVTGWTPGRFPLTSVIELPFMHNTAVAGSRMLADLWAPYLKKEYDDVHLLYLHVHPAGHLHTHSKPIRVLEDFQGMKIRTPTAIVGDLLDLLGAAKVVMPANEIYQNMATKSIDGFAMPFEALPSFRLYEVAKYHTDVGMYTTAFAMFMNKATYESLPADVRQVFADTTAAKVYWGKVGELWDKAEVVGRRALQERKEEIYTLPKDERRRWRAVVQSLDDKWATDLEAKGLPGKRLIEAARELSTKYGATD